MRQLIPLAALSLLAVGCMKNTEIKQERLVMASITPSITMGTTKAILDNANINGQKIRVQIAKGDGSVAYSNDTESKQTLSYGTSWTLSNPVYLSSDNAKIYAYCPCPTDPAPVETGAYSTLKRILDVPSTATMTSQVDYLWANQDKTAPNGTDNINNDNMSVALKLNHALAQVAFVIYKSNYPGTGNLTAVKIKDNSTTPSLKINKSGTNDLAMAVADGAITGGQTTSEIAATSIAKSIESTDPGTDAATLKSKVSAYILLAPVTITDNTKVQYTFTIDGSDYTTSLTGIGGVIWEAGKQYIYKVKLSGTALTISGVTVSDWTSNYNGEVIIQ